VLIFQIQMAMRARNEGGLNLRSCTVVGDCSLKCRTMKTVACSHPFHGRIQRIQKGAYKAASMLWYHYRARRQHVHKHETAVKTLDCRNCRSHFRLQYARHKANPRWCPAPVHDPVPRALVVSGFVADGQPVAGPAWVHLSWAARERSEGSTAVEFGRAST